MKLFIDRAESDDVATRSRLSIDGKASGYVLERGRLAGTDGIVRIPAGTYAIELKPLGASRFDAQAGRIMTSHGGRHLGMPRLVDVPGRSEILIHWGNYWHDTEGCLLVGASAMLDPKGKLAVGMSQRHYAALYPALAQAALSLDATITIAEGA